MTENLLYDLAIIVALGMLAQWLAWRLHLPSILLLLLFGLLAGPVFGALDPDVVFGDLLFPVVSVFVAIILFEGGLSLKFRELREVGATVVYLSTVGALVTWALAAAAAHYIAGVGVGLSVLLGAILIVSGPTVIIPLLRQIRPSRRVGSIAKWEGIVNDPIGAIMAALVFEALLAGGFEESAGAMALMAIKALFFGLIVGVLAALAIVVLMRRRLLPDFLQSPVTLALVIASYVTADALQSESGLLAVTAMGIALANQKYVSIKKISDFKENLRALLIATLFIMLAARLPAEQVLLTDISAWLFVGALILVVRPLATLASTFGSGLSWRERAFLAWMAPRGIVAAAVVSLFSLKLEEAGFVGAGELAPLTFMVIIGTVAIYGLSAPFLARKLKVAQPNPQGVLFAGAHRWAREMALALDKEGLKVALVDTNRENVSLARQAGLSAHYGNVLDEDFLYEVDLEGIGRLLSMTPNDEVNSLAALHFEELFGRDEVYQLSPAEQGRTAQADLPRHLRGHYLFSEDATFGDLEQRFRAGAAVKKTPLTEEFTFASFREMYGAGALPLMIIDQNKKLKILAPESDVSPEQGDTLVSVIIPADSHGAVRSAQYNAR
ncbi:MAG: sodium:proton antiporter [candidate division Zixibacteria bacterium]|nr:sodium:proton antiporter [candidate division Zixibacteria bacterium]